MSTLYVDNLQPNLGSQVEIPDFKPHAGMQIQHKQNTHTTFDSTANVWTDVVTQTITPKYDNSLIIVRYNGHLYKYNAVAFPSSKARITHDQGGAYTEIVNHPYVIYNDANAYMYSLSMAARFTVSNTNEYTIRMQIDPKTSRTYIYSGSNLFTVEEIAQ